MKKKPTLFKLTVAFFFALISQTIIAQQVQDNQKALALVKKNAAAIGLSDDNIANCRIANTYVDAVSGATFVYLQQTFMGIDVDKSIQVLAFKNGSLVSSTGKRIDMSRSTINASPTLQKKSAAPAVTVEAAIRAAAQHLHLPAPSINARPAIGQDFTKPVDFGSLNIAKDRVTARLLWVPQKTFERVKLTWEVNLSPKGTPDSWRVIVDAKGGEVIKKDNYTVPDNWHKRNQQFRSENITGMGSSVPDNLKSQPQQNITSASYRVIPFPAEAPNFPNGTPSLVTDPWKLSPHNSGATPFIWNDDGIHQYQYTRGNNVLAQTDRNGNNGVGKRAVGSVRGNHLYFDFIPDFNKEPTDSANWSFAVTNLFYWNNIMHDLSYQYGFDEQAGNFQRNNLDRGGMGNDYVFADALDGISYNNANFYTPADGQSPRMQMFLFTGDPAKTMIINTPASIAGNVPALEGSFNSNNTLANVGPVTGNVILYDEATDTFHFACDPASNSGALKGKIALINRGNCAFNAKVFNAQTAGAIAVIVVDNIPGEPLFPWGSSDSSIVIPAVMIGYEDGLKIKEVLATGTAVNVTLTSPPATDGDLDNGVISHEYTHGISNRLTGGPSNVACLFNAEQMGEGWSDYIALMTITDWSTAQPYDGLNPRSIGSYVSNQPPTGTGIRFFPYSVNMSINPHTYADVAISGGEPHYVGEIWASVLWDMTWFIIQQDGINKDIFNAQGEGGNTVAYKLVMTGMKLQPCSPGFIDGRDAILKADTLLYNGRHSCAIWRAFARRGMGVNASQGSSDAVGDEQVDFAESGVIITKHVDRKSIIPGVYLNYTIGLKAKGICGRNVKQDYSVTDSLPDNVVYVSSDGTYNPSNRTVTFSNIDMDSGDSLTFKIRVRVKLKTIFPDSVYLNDNANTPTISGKWAARDGNSLAWTKIYFGNDDYAYYSNDASVKDAETLVTTQGYFIPGNTTTLSFYHQFLSNDFNNGGVVEITTDGGKIWEDLGPYMNPAGLAYTETITGNSVLQGRKAFSGFGIGYGYYGTTTIDLSHFAGKKAKIRFRYATSDSSFAIPDGGTGWVIDDIVLSASPSVSNTAQLFNQKNKLTDYSTVETKIKGWKWWHDFIAVNHNNTDALLTWHTPGELNGTFKVERSVDKGVTFKEIGAVNSTDNSADVQTYQFTDAAPAEGTNLYRIHHIGSNGTVDYTEIQSLNFDNLKGINVYPNPTKDRINVHIPGNNKSVTLQLTNGLGKEIKTYKAAGQNITLHLPALAAGVYYLNVIKADGTISKQKVVVE